MTDKVMVRAKEYYSEEYELVCIIDNQTNDETIVVYKASNGLPMVRSINDFFSIYNVIQPY